MKKLPTRISIFGNIYKIRQIKDLKDSQGRGVWGLCDVTSQIISVEKNLFAKRKWSTLYHEIGHAICYECSLSEADSWNHEFEHQIVEAYAKFLEKYLHSK